ncbi:hypothetical protein B0A55_04032 [Friedmanniomyces simplex]|uniref:Zn(2)-C6 fungal-type domain-containing protein n=1 Tax=Friedmanniomyces simplex TaxID=329884 RepID=A0A4U0XD71_9PEZI|nr:hypothetical protein B0A55_04032 [Friedmanniomyces simplex]
MAEAIVIPSPTAFLTSSPPAPPSPPKDQAVRRPNADGKKKTVGRKSGVGAGGAGDGNGAKLKQSKSRNAKRLKCGEEKPGCQQCKRRGVDCGGYKKDFKWRPFEDSNVKINIDRQRRTSPPGQGSAQSSKPTTPAEESAPQSNSPEQPPDDTPRRAKRKDSKRRSTADEDQIITQLPQRPAKAKRKAKPPQRSGEQHNPPLEPPPESIPLPPDSPEAQESIAIEAAHTTSHDNSQHLTAPVLGLSPTLTEILRPYSDDHSQDGDFIDFSLPEGMSFPLTPVPAIDPAMLREEGIDDDQVDDVLRSDALPFHSPTRGQSPSSPLSSSDMQSLWRGPVNYLYSQPYFRQDSPEMLTFRFDRLTCGILSIMDGPTENPWRSLIWPLAQQSPALYHAVTAMTAYHSATDIPALRVAGHEHKQASIRYIQEGIRDNSMTDQMAIATALALGFSESWDQHTASGNTHIKGAQALVKRALADHQQRPLRGVELARLKFLCNAWVYMDVIARLTAVDSDESNDFDNTFLFSPDAPNMVMGDSGPPGFGIDFGMPIDARLDPLMGCANTLFPLIGRVANLVRRVCRSQTNSPAVISQANDLKLALETWDPPAFIERPEDPTTDVQHTLQTAEAYRWATLLHLHQSVPELPGPSSAELAQRVLQYLATVPLASRTVIVQIYPLMVAGCEAATSEDRQWVRDRWNSMSQRMRIGVIEKSATVTEEVWRRRDAYEAQPTTRRKLVATAELQPARQRGIPLVKTDDGFQDSDPGRTGMVFSYVDVDGGGGGGGEGNAPSSNERFPRRRKGPDRIMGSMDAAYTVRGHLHWVGVMWDWGWEILLG